MFLSLDLSRFVLPSCMRRDEITSYMNISIKKQDLKSTVETKRETASLLENIEPCDNQGRRTRPGFHRTARGAAGALTGLSPDMCTS